MSTPQNTPENSSDEKQQLPMESDSELLQLAQSCTDVDEFRTLMEDRGFWLNRKAAESAFFSLRQRYDEELSDEELTGVVGGIATAHDSTDLFRMIFSC